MNITFHKALMGVEGKNDLEEETSGSSGKI